MVTGRRTYFTRAQSVRIPAPRLSSIGKDLGVRTNDCFPFIGLGRPLVFDLYKTRRQHLGNGAQLACEPTVHIIVTDASGGATALRRSAPQIP